MPKFAIMRWSYSIKNKLAASLVLLALCLLVLLSNYLDRLHTENVKGSISTMYEDRLIVEGQVLRMTQNIYRIRELLLTAGESTDKAQVQRLLARTREVYDTFIKTKLTKTETITAKNLLVQLKLLESSSEDRALAINHTGRILDSLDRLSAIQLEESKLIMQQVESQYATIKASSQFAFAIVIVILVVLQIMVFSGEPLVPMFKPKDPTLN